MHFLVAVDIYRNDHHDRSGGHPHQEGEVSDINAPRHLVTHAGDDEAVDKLLAVGVEADEANAAQNAHPHVIAPVANKGDFSAALQEYQIVANSRRHTSK